MLQSNNSEWKAGRDINIQIQLNARDMTDTDQTAHSVEPDGHDDEGPQNDPVPYVDPDPDEDVFPPFPAPPPAYKEALKKHPPPQSSSSVHGMKPAQDVISRILWDKKLPSENFIVGYIDGFGGKIEKPFTAFNWDHFSTVDPEASPIPCNRIQFFKYGDTVVWDRRNHSDLIFGSGIVQNQKDKDNEDVITEELEKLGFVQEGSVPSAEGRSEAKLRPESPFHCEKANLTSDQVELVAAHLMKENKELGVSPYEICGKLREIDERFVGRNIKGAGGFYRVVKSLIEEGLERGVYKIGVNRPNSFILVKDVKLVDLPTSTTKVSAPEV